MWWLLVLGLASGGLYLAALTIPDWGREFTRFATVYGLLIVAYLGAVWGVVRTEAPAPGASAKVILGASGGRALAVIWAGAVLFRLVVLAAPPTLSDDLYRYLWDGRVLLHGINPYRYPPAAPELAGLRDALWPLINNPGLPTIYPPLLQLVFAAVAAVSPTVLAWKAAAVLFDLAAGFFLMAALARRGRPRTWVLLYLWHPLTVVEFAGSGHSDAVGFFFLALAFWLAAGGRRWGSGLALTLAGLVKFLPWVALPALLRRLRWGWLAFPVLAALAYLPFHLHGVNALGSLGVFAAKWRANDFLFAEFLPGGGGPATAAALKQAKLLAAAVPAAVWILTLVFRRPPASVFSWTAGAVLLVSPVVHPWYVLWLLIPAVLLAQPAWWTWTLTVFLAYAPLPLFRATGVWSESHGLKLLEYLPVLGLIPLQVWIEVRRARTARRLRSGPA